MVHIHFVSTLEKDALIKLFLGMLGSVEDG